MNHTPGGKEWKSWLLVSLWACFIFLSVPLARPIQRFIRESWGSSFFIYVVVATIVILVLVAVYKTSKTRKLKPVNYIFLITVSGVFFWLTYQLRGNPEEAIHFVQYGILSILVFRALTLRAPDNTSYFTAVALVCAIGIIDEALQWLAPQRYWGLRDIRLDAIAAVLTIFAIRFGINPGIISEKPSSQSIQLLLRAVMLTLGLLALSLFNTPQRILASTEIFPSLEFLIKNSSIMAEYGFYYKSDDTGIFRSRLSPANLQKTDSLRHKEAADILKTEGDPKRFKEFIKKYSPFSDPFLHEFRVHLKSRSHNLRKAGEYRSSDDNKYKMHITSAYFENIILEKYFSLTLRESGYVLPEKVLRDMRENAVRDSGYKSKVSKNLITVFSVQAFQWLFLGTILSLVFLDLYICYKRKRQ